MTNAFGGDRSLQGEGSGHECDGQLLAFFRRVYAALPAGGVFVFDFAKSSRTPGGMPLKGSWSGKHWTIDLNSRTTLGGRLLHRQFTTSRSVRGRTRITTETHTLRLYDAKVVVSTLRQAGFAVHTLGHFGSLRVPAGSAAVLAVKPEL